MVERASKFVLLLAGSVLFMLVLYQYAAPGSLGFGAPRGSGSDAATLFPTPDPHYVDKFYFPVRDLRRAADFQMRGEDVIVFLHIQKTGGTTFGRHLVQNVRLEVPCDCRPGQKKCTCHRPNSKEPWLFSRFSTGWSCGLHADWTELTSCVPGVLGRRDRTVRKFHYITLLRDPVSRYLSEWRHVQRGATWKTSLHMCDGRVPTPEELPPCYDGADWSGCTLDQFMDCPYNLANNRQVRMLADLSLVGCYNLSTLPGTRRAQLLLDSAKKNLRDMAFFGLTEHQRKTQYLFERAFRLRFIRPFAQYNSTHAGGVDLDAGAVRRIQELNELDVQLYEYARDLFQQRYRYQHALERRERRLRLLRDAARPPTQDYMSQIVHGW